MIKSALILTGSRAGDILLGITILERQIVSLEKAGIGKIFVAGDPDGRIEELVRKSKTLRRRNVSPRIISRAAAFPVKNGDILLIEPGAVFGWQDAKTAAETSGKKRYLDLSGSDAARVIPASGVKSLLDDHFKKGSAKKAAGKGTAFPGRGAVLVAGKQSWKRARRELLVSMRKPTDGFVSRNFNRYVSLFLTRFFLVLRLTPNMISFGNLGVGFFGAFLIGLGGAVNTLVAGLIFQLTSIVDGCDGEVAKLAFRDSEKGAWIDTVCDQLGYLSFFIGLPIGLYRTTSNPLYMFLGGFTLVSIPLLFFVMTRYVRKRGKGGSMLLLIEHVQKSASLPGAFGLANKIVFGLSFLIRRDFFAFLAMAFCIGGFFSIVPVIILQWLISVSVVLMVLFLVFFSWYVSRKPVPGLD